MMIAPWYTRSIQHLFLINWQYACAYIMQLIATAYMLGLNYKQRLMFGY